FFQVFLIEKYNYTASQIGNFFGFLGLCIALSQGLIVRPISKRFRSDQILPITVLLLSIAIAIQLVPDKVLWVYFIVPFIAVFNGLTLPNSTALVSNLTPKDRQGEILGINQSFQAIGMAIPPLLAGFFAAVHFVLPIVIGALLIFSAWLVFILFFRRSQRA
ncbi:MAG: MFS transporter, partial [Candidatus Nanoarchaeia archaeon]